MTLDLKRQVEYWTKTAEHDWDTAQALWRAKKYDACLFFCHLVIEKILKAAVVRKTKQYAPRVHNLVHLIQSADMPLDDRQNQMLAQMNHFNIAVRYPIDQKEFYKLATKKFSEPYYKFTRGFLLWAKENRH